MRKIEHKGNMPPLIALFAKGLQGKFSGQKETEFFECSSINEFEKNASEIGYEIYPAMDATTERGYLVGFEAEDTGIVTVGGETYAQLKMYYIECTKEEFDSWVKKIKKHRDMQQQDYFYRTQDNKRRLI